MTATGGCAGATARPDPNIAADTALPAIAALIGAGGAELGPRSRRSRARIVPLGGDLH